MHSRASATSSANCRRGCAAIGAGCPPDGGWWCSSIQDDDDCRELKAELEQAAAGAGLLSRTTAGARPWQVVNRVAIEELEAWYFGEWEAVRGAYPRVSRTVPQQARYRDPDAIRGGTWEAFERVLQRRGYFKTGLRKLEAARQVAAHFDPDRSRSHSFEKLRAVIAEAAG